MRRTFVLPLALLAGCFYDPPSIADSTADESTGDGGDMNPTTMPPPATTSPADTGPPPDGEGRIVYRQNGRLFLLTLGEGTRDISSELVSLGWAEAGMDPYINISSDGEWLVLDTERAHESCDGWACLAVVRTDLSEGEPLLNNFEAMHPEAGADVAEGGGLVVFSGIGTVNTTDLFVSVREGDFWSAPLLITAESTFEENRHPALSPDGSSVLFDCGDWGDRSICEVGVDGSGFGRGRVPRREPGRSRRRPAPRQLRARRRARLRGELARGVDLVSTGRG